MATIWKYAVSLKSPFTHRMPQGSRILNVRVQHQQPEMWALIPSRHAETPLVERKFTVVGTGHEFDPEPLSYVGTFEMKGGLFIFHLFEHI